jgi:steroid delta-isomerase-like uncharacterized protein
MSEANKALIRRWFDEVWTKGSVDAIDELMSTSAVICGLGEDFCGPDGFKPFHAAYRAAFPDVEIHVDDVVAEGDMVAARWSGSGTHRGDALGFPATGKRVEFRGMVFARVEDGKLVAGWNNFDQLGMLQQLGAVK